MTKKYIITFSECDRNLPVPPSSFHSLDGGKTIHPLLHDDSIGKLPSEFSPDRSFWIPLEMLYHELVEE